MTLDRDYDVRVADRLWPTIKKIVQRHDLEEALLIFAVLNILVRRLEQYLDTVSRGG